MLETKTGQQMYKFSLEVWEVLKGLPKHPSGFVFPMSKVAIDSMWDRVRIAAGLPRLQFRDLRHLGATDWIRRGLNAHQLKHVLGHMSIATAQFYVDLVGADIEDALDEASAKGGVMLIPPEPPADVKAHIRYKRSQRMKECLAKKAESATLGKYVEADQGDEPSPPTASEADHAAEQAAATAPDTVPMNPGSPPSKGAVIISFDALRKARKAA